MKLHYKSNKFNNNFLRFVVRVVMDTFIKRRGLMGVAKTVLTDFQTLFENIMKRQDDGLVFVLNELAFDGITFIVDAANIALTSDDSTNPAKIEETREALSLFTRLTKQETKVRTFIISIIYIIVVVVVVVVVVVYCEIIRLLFTDECS